MDLTVLANELTGALYKGKSDEECANIVNAKTVTTKVPVSIADLKELAIGQDVWSDLQISANNSSESLPKRKLAISIVSCLGEISNYKKLINLDEPSAIQKIGQLKAFGFLSTEQVSILQKQAEVTMPWTEYNNIGPVGIGYIQLARRMNDSK